MNSIGTEEFMEATLDVWDISPESATATGHPAPFPVALPRRLIELYTYVGDLVVDPFVGSGSTPVAAVRTGRHYLGIDTDETYAAAARARVAAEPPPALTGPAPKAAELTEALLARDGFIITGTDVNVGAGLSCSYEVRDTDGRLWLVDVAGTNATPQPGLTTSEALNRVLAKAAVVAGSRLAGRPHLAPLLIATPAMPRVRSGGRAALAAAETAGLIVGVVDLNDPTATLSQPDHEMTPAAR